MNKVTPGFVFVLSTLSIQPVYAQAEIIGVGASSCGEVMAKFHKARFRHGIISWVQGYLSCIDTCAEHFGKPDLDLPDSRALEAYIKDYCQKNPLSDLDQAADALAEESGLH